ncbi:unnamed protein product [Effrenium voratum]|nr:unnamed protein product [Effrenium voratum]
MEHREYLVQVDRSQGQKLGIDVDSGEKEVDCPVVLAVKDGLIRRWNELNPSQEVHRGHRIVEVNGHRGAALKQALREEQRLLLRMQVEDTVRGLACSPVSPTSESREELPTLACRRERRLGQLPSSSWMHVTWFLYSNELLGKFMRLNSSFAALLGDERCWQTLALPRSPAATEKLLKLMMVEEQELWSWPLCQVQLVDLDLSNAQHSTLQQLRAMLMKKLDVEENLQTLRLWNLPVCAKPLDSNYSDYDRELIRLVNPVHPKYPAGFCSSFLVTDELGQLRTRLHAFRFRMEPAEGKAIHVLADRGLGSSWESGPQDLSQHAEQLVEFELGALRKLPPCNVLVTDRFDHWKERMAKTYKRMLAMRTCS